MSNPYARRRYAVRFVIALVVCVLLLSYDWTRHRPIDIFFDIVLVVIMAIAVLKSLIDSRSESESQRLLSDLLNQR